MVEEPARHEHATFASIGACKCAVTDFEDASRGKVLVP